MSVSSVGGSGKYIEAISETDGKISATVQNIADTVTVNNMQSVSSNAVAQALSGGDFLSKGLKRTYNFVKNIPKNTWTDLVTSSDITGGLYLFRLYINDNTQSWSENLSFVLYFYRLYLSFLNSFFFDNYYLVDYYLIEDFEVELTEAQMHLLLVVENKNILVKF